MKRNHKIRRRRCAAAVLAAALTVTGLMQVFGSDTTGGLHTIDTSRPCSLHIYKYDQYSTETLNQATGERDTSIENAMKEHAVANVEFTVLRVGDIQTKTVAVDDTEQIEVFYSLPDELAVTDLGMTASAATTIKGQTGKKYYTSDQIMKALNARLSADNTGTKNALKTYADNKANGGIAVTTDENGEAVLTGLNAALYLVVETKVPQNISSTTNPFFVSLPMTNAAGDQYLYDLFVYPKNQNDVPTIDKVVQTPIGESYADSGTASIGDLLSYRVATRIAGISDSATYYSTWKVTDTLTDSLDYVDITDKTKTVVQAYDTADAAQQGGVPSAEFQLTAEDYEISHAAGTRTFTVSLTESGLRKLNHPANSGKYIGFAYQARLNRNAILGEAGAADTGNDNTAELTWGRTSETYTQTIKDISRVYAYAIDLTKLLSDNPETAAQLLPTVAFTLYSETEKKPVSADQISSGTYRVNDEHTEGFTFHPDSEGRISMEGLAAGSYTLSETKSAANYALLKNPISIVITSSEAAVVAGTAGHNDRNTQETVRSTAAGISTSRFAAATVDGNKVEMSAAGDSAHAIVNLQVTNTKSWIPNLPKTGGLGTMLLAVAGAILIGLGLSIRRHENDPL